MPNQRQDTRSFVAACAQLSVHAGDVARNLQAVEAAVRDCHAQGAELVVLPEMWTTSYVAAATPELVQAAEQAEQRILELSAELSLMVIGSGLEADGESYYNRCMVMDRGQVLGSYRKIHLFSPIAEQRLVQPGEEPLILDTRCGRIGVLICYDIRFPELVRYLFYQGVELLVVPAQWPEARSDHWRTILKARAIENQMFVLGCNRTGTERSMKTDDTLVFPGDSRIIDPMGHILAAGDGEATPVCAEVELRKIRTMQRILPIRKDSKVDVHRLLWAPLLGARLLKGES